MKTAKDISILSDIFDFSVWDGNHIFIAQLGTYNINGIETTRDFRTIALHDANISKLQFSDIYKLSDSESLTVSWENGNNIHLAVDQSLPKHYRLSCRLDNEQVIWDDLSLPRYNVIENKQSSLYKFPRYSEAYVKIDSDYLTDYLATKKLNAIQVFQERRVVTIDEEIADLLGSEEFFIQQSQDFEIRIQKHSSKEDWVYVEVNGFRKPVGLDKIKTSVKQYSVGHYWKGIDGLVTSDNARHFFPFQYGYVSDSVLTKYESDDDYEIYPDSGSVYYGNQWCVSYCDRVGRNAIRVELKKLYEGTPSEVIDHWNSFTIDPSTINKSETNIAELCERLLRKYLLFGRLFTQITNKTLQENFTTSQFLAYDEIKIERVGLLQYDEFKTISHHVSLNDFSKDQFTARCKSLYKILVEGLNESTLRNVVNKLGFSQDVTKSFRSLKLLDLILRYYYTATMAGLNPEQDKTEILSRVEEYKQICLASELFALNDLRQLDAHRSDKSHAQRFKTALENLAISKNSIANSYARASDTVFESITTMFADVNSFLIRAYDF
jgi:hypothetical protein